MHIKLLHPKLMHLFIFLVDFQSICNKETTKLLTLVQNCQERAIHIISSSQTNGNLTHNIDVFSFLLKFLNIFVLQTPKALQ